MAKDDALAWPKVARREYPSATCARMESTIAPFVRKSFEINATLINTLNDKLGLPEGTLAKRHTLEEYSGSEARCIKTAPRTMSEEEAAIGAHTDFGSLSFLHNRLGGLQVLVPGTEQWQYIKVSHFSRFTIRLTDMHSETLHQPIPGHAVCNLGDAMAIFSGGILRSNLHRVM